MNPLQIGFIAFAILMIGVSLYVLLRPLLEKDERDFVPADQASAALAVLREQFIELEADRALDGRDQLMLDTHRAELERRALDEGVANTRALDFRPSRSWAGVVAVFVVVAAIVGYAGWGEPAALVAGNTQRPHASGDNDAIKQMVDGMAARLAQESGSPQEWVMLARSYIVLEDYDMAVAAFNKLEADAPADADVLADWAEAVALKNNGVDAASEALAFKALDSDPLHIKALLLAGTAAYEREDFVAAVKHWQNVLDQHSEDDMILLRETVADARVKAGL